MSQTRLNNTSLWCTTYQIRELNKRVYDSYCMNLRLYFPYYLKCGLIKHVYNITYAYYEYASVISAASQTCFDANVSSAILQTCCVTHQWCGVFFLQLYGSDARHTDKKSSTMKSSNLLPHMDHTSIRDTSCIQRTSSQWCLQWGRRNMPVDPVEESAPWSAKDRVYT